MRIAYKHKSFRQEARTVIYHANQILEEYAGMGFDLTLRQLYYQFVARDLIPNQQKEYNRLGTIINDARLAGLIDWNQIVDRTRELVSVPHWSSPASIIASCAKQFSIDRWKDQATRVEVWIEKDALVGVIEGVCQDNDVAYFSCRGYTSQSEMWSAAQRIGKYLEDDQDVVILHLGDHDPSGIDMTRDIYSRLALFLGVDYLYRNEEDDGEVDALDWVDYHFKVRRIALTMDQVEEHNPPPNPAKLTDSRANAYIREFGRESWELDALDPITMSNLIESYILKYRNSAVWAKACEEQNANREQLAKVSDRWSDIVKMVS